jgi:hypothetical protein
MSDDTNTTYGFTYKDCDNKLYKQEITIDEVTWPEVLNDFVDFLQHVYGYNIKDSIRIREPRYETFPESWSGEYFSEEE